MIKRAFLVVRRCLACVFLLTLPILPVRAVVAADNPAAPARVSENGRYLVDAEGKPFLWVGDTAWELFHRLDLEEATRYLRDRQEKGFTVVQAVVLAERDGLNTPNALGDLPLVDRDPARPVEAYFRHVDAIVAEAGKAGLVVGMLPTWGSYWKSGSQQRVFTPENARTFGRFLGSRYRDSAVVWILGGDNNIEHDDERAIIDALAAGLHEGDGGKHLATFHPRGPGLSSRQVHEASWLDFNMYQSSHASGALDTGLFAAHDRALSPAKPTLDGEPRYEAIVAGFYFANADPFVRIDDFDARRAAYWSLLAGAAGHTYGNNNIWQMWAPGREVVLAANTPWWRALDHPGAFQMGHLRRLFTARPFWKLAPAQDLIPDGPRTGGAKVRAALAEDGSFALVYSPEGEPFTVDDTRLKGSRIKQTWFDPRYGVAYPFHTASSAGFQTFTPPTRGRGQDWVLVLEDEAAALPALVAH